MKKPDNVSIGDIYGTMLNSIKRNLHESIKPGGNDLTDKDPLPLEDGGPNEKSGYNKALNDEDFKDEDEEDGVSKYIPKWKKTTEELHNKSKDTKTDEKTKKKLKDVVI